MRNRIWLSVFLALAIAAGALRWRVPTPSSRFIAPAQRRVLPELELNLVDDTRWRLSTHRGQVLLINYWATWCEPCEAEMPALNQLAKQHADGDVALVGISLNEGADAAARVRQFVSRFGIIYPVGLGQNTLNSASDVIGIPNTLLVDRQGRLARIYAGPIRSSDVESDLRALVREP